MMTSKVGEEEDLYSLQYSKTNSYQKSGSPGRIRTGDLSINSRMLYR